MKPKEKKEALAILLGTNKLFLPQLVSVACAVCAALLYASSVHANALSIKSDGTTAGYVTLGWVGETNSSFTLQAKKGDTWTTLYSGSDTATTLTGLPNGTYHYRLSKNNGPWSEPLKVVINHHPLWKAYSFFICGFILFLVLCLLLFLRPAAEGHDTGQQTRSY